MTLRTLLLVLITWLLTWQALGLEKVSINAHEQKLTIEINDARLDEIVTALGEYLDFETLVIGDYSRSKTITARLKSLPVSAAVERIVANANSLIVYSSVDVNDATRRITQVWLLESEADFTIAAPAASTSNNAVNSQPRESAPDPGLASADSRKRSYAVLRLARDFNADRDNSDTYEVTLAELTRALLYDPDPLVRTRAATALGRARDRRAVSALQSALSDEHLSVRNQAINALGNIGGTAAITILGGVLTSDGVINDTERAIAAQVLWRQDSDVARYFLKKGAADSNRQIRELSNTRPKKPSARRNPNAASQPASTQ